MKNTEANYETSQISKIELFARITKGFHRCLNGFSLRLLNITKITKKYKGSLHTSSTF